MESKKTKDDDFENSKSLLPNIIKQVLEDGLRDGFIENFLSLCTGTVTDAMIPEICGWLTKLEGRVTELHLIGNKITSTGVIELMNHLKSTKSTIQRIMINSNPFDDACIPAIGEYIQMNQSIYFLCIGGSKITDEGISILCKYLEGNTTFKELSLMGAILVTNTSLPILQKTIENSTIQFCDVKYTSISHHIVSLGYLCACNAIKNKSNRILSMGSYINDEHLIPICKLMKDYGVENLKEIDLSYNYLTSKGAKLLFETLKECKSSATRITIIHNFIRDDCMESLCQFMERNNFLEILDISYNLITDNAIEILSEALPGNTVLKDLHLTGCRSVTDASYGHLRNIATRTYIESISCNETALSGEIVQELSYLLQIPKNHRAVPINSNTKSASKSTATA